VEFLCARNVSFLDSLEHSSCSTVLQSRSASGINASPSARIRRKATAGHLLIHRARGRAAGVALAPIKTLDSTRSSPVPHRVQARGSLSRDEYSDDDMNAGGDTVDAVQLDHSMDEDLLGLFDFGGPDRVGPQTCRG